MRILFSAWPAWGHILPMLPLVRAAQRAGHDVAFSTGPDMVDELDRRGIAAWATGPTAAEAGAALHEAYPDHDQLPVEQRMPLSLVRFFGPASVIRAKTLVPRARLWSPDIVVHDPSEVAGAIAAVAIGAMHVMHGLSPTPPGIEPLVRLLAAYPAQQLDLPELGEQMLAATQLDISPPGLSANPTLSNSLLLRPTAGENDGAAPLPGEFEKLPHRRTVYLTLGTIVNTSSGAFDAALAGLRELPVNVVVTTGPGVDPAGLGAQPANVLVRQFLPQAALLPACDAIVSHAGAGTMLGGLCHGLPQVCLPMGADQPMNAASLARVGAGITLGPGERTAAAVRDAVIKVLDDPSYRRAAGTLQQEIAAMPSADETLDSLIELRSRRIALVHAG